MENKEPNKKVLSRFYIDGTGNVVATDFWAEIKESLDTYFDNPQKVSVIFCPLENYENCNPL